MIRATVYTALLLIGGASFALAGDRYERRPYWEAPVKDCTRYNGRWGYYGNPWCNAREQEAFDRWEARRLARRWR